MTRTLSRSKFVQEILEPNNKLLTDLLNNPEKYSCKDIIEIYCLYPSLNIPQRRGLPEILYKKILTNRLIKIIKVNESRDYNSRDNQKKKNKKFLEGV